MISVMVVLQMYMTGCLKYSLFPCYAGEIIKAAVLYENGRFVVCMPIRIPKKNPG